MKDNVLIYNRNEYRTSTIIEVLGEEFQTSLYDIQIESVKTVHDCLECTITAPVDVNGETGETLRLLAKVADKINGLEIDMLNIGHFLTTPRWECQLSIYLPHNEHLIDAALLRDYVPEATKGMQDGCYAVRLHTGYSVWRITDGVGKSICWVGENIAKTNPHIWDNPVKTILPIPSE